MLEKTSNHRVAWTAAGIVGATLATAVVGGLASKPGRWYENLSKPPGTPPNSVFGPVWGLLYAGIAYAGVRLAMSPKGKERTRALAWWSAQLALNAAWSPLFFGLKRPFAALGLMGVLVPSIAAATYAAKKVDRPSALLMAPYLAWTSYATYLNAGIALKNAA